jgi:hypothetical protein
MATFMMVGQIALDRVAMLNPRRQRRRSPSHLRERAVTADDAAQVIDPIVCGLARAGRGNRSVHFASAIALASVALKG